mmetsp:Transcript_8163/g.11766  ORF Transcript_8163/g.11766 Transcript_8163/m.11766 type:complete len:1036 (+) Transcript_8163:185-3292(+)
MPTKDNPTAIPLPSASTVWYDPRVATDTTQQQQPETTPIAHFESTPPHPSDLGSWLDVNANYVVYAVKNGLVRVLDRRSPNRTLLRGHVHKKVSDVQFFQSGDVLGTVGGNVLIWRIYNNNSNGDNDASSDSLMAEKLLELPQELGATRMVWHPLNPNQFWILHSSSENDNKNKIVATLVETTRITTNVHPFDDSQHAVCQLHSNHVVMEGAIQIETDSSINDLAWSGRDPRHVLTTHEDGSINLWDIQQVQSESGSPLVRPTCVATLHESSSVQRCFFLPHDDTSNSSSSSTTINVTAPFVTATHHNSRVTIWSPFTTSSTTLPQKLSMFCMDDDNTNNNSGGGGGYNLAPCFGGTPVMNAPPASFLLLSDRSHGHIYAIALKSKWSPDKRAILEGWSYVVPFTTLHPIYSWSLTCAPAQNVDDDDDDVDNVDDNNHEKETTTPQTTPMIDMHLYSVQSRAVQLLTLTHAMCIPPLQTWNTLTTNAAATENGIRVEEIQPNVVTEPYYENDAAANAGLIVDDAQFEDYEDEDDDDDDYNDNNNNNNHGDMNESSTLFPSPTADNTNNNDTNPFANWLGSIVSGGGSSSVAETTTTTTAEEKIVVPPAEDTLPPPPPPPPPTPNVIQPIPPPGLPVPPMPEPEPASRNGSGFLSPMELLGVGSTSTTTSPAAAVTSTGVVGARRATPSPNTTTSAATGAAAIIPSNKDEKKKNTKKTKAAARSKSPKPKKGTAKQSNGSGVGTKGPTMPIPSADGKIAILKRDAGVATPLGTPASAATTSLSAGTTTTTSTGISASDMEYMLGKALNVHFKKYESTMRDEIQRSVRSEVQNTVIPTLSKTIAQTMEQSVVKPLQTSMKQYAKESTKVRTEEVVDAISNSVEQPLQSAFQESMKTVMIPAYESATREMFSQISSSLDQGLVLSSTRSDSSAKLLVEMATKLDSMSQQMDALSKEVTQLKSQVSAAAAAAPSGPTQSSMNAAAGGVGPGGTQLPPPQQNKSQAIRDEIMFLLSTRSYEAAFTKALSASTAEMAVFLL